MTHTLFADTLAAVICMAAIAHPRPDTKALRTIMSWSIMGYLTTQVTHVKTPSDLTNALSTIDFEKASHQSLEDLILSIILNSIGSETMDRIKSEKELVSNLYGKSPVTRFQGE